MNMEGARNDQAELIDVERLLVKVIGAAGNGTERAFPRAMPRRDDHLGIGLQCQYFLKRREPFGGAIRIGRKAKVERDHIRLLGAQYLHRLRPVARSEENTSELQSLMRISNA